MAGARTKNSSLFTHGSTTHARGLFTAALLITSLAPVSLPTIARAATPIRFSGELGGIVTDVAGKPQPGAMVLLFNSQDRLLLKVATDGLGTFAFAELIPDLYSIQDRKSV